MSRHVVRIGIAVLVLTLLTGCAGLDFSVLASGRSSAGGGRVPAVGNNDQITLVAGTYSGDVRIDGNNATVEGAGVNATVIRGDVTIEGNSVTIRDLTIEGRVTINANGADLRGARIEGGVDDNGNSNRL